MNGARCTDQKDAQASEYGDGIEQRLADEAPPRGWRGWLGHAA